MLLEVIQSFMKSRSKKSRRIGLILALAAGLILLIGMPVAFHRIKESRNSALVYEQYFAPYPYLLHERSIPDNISALDNRAMYLYTINNYAEAAALMEKESSDSLTNPLQNLYLGVCYMELKQYSNAIKIFETLLSKDQNLTNHQARWYLGLSYIKLNKRTKATEQLNILQADSGLYTYQALEILNKLKQN
jgi:tetratricopeptide (TPR) repeat protein